MVFIAFELIHNQHGTINKGIEKERSIPDADGRLPSYIAMCSS